MTSILITFICSDYTSVHHVHYSHRSQWSGVALPLQWHGTYVPVDRNLLTSAFTSFFFFLTLCYRDMLTWTFKELMKKSKNCILDVLSPAFYLSSYLVSILHSHSFLNPLFSSFTSFFPVFSSFSIFTLSVSLSHSFTSPASHIYLYFYFFFHHLSSYLSHNHPPSHPHPYHRIIIS